jgi:ABC-type Zn uptake system ZnuABC Zn-binding protein ZnuA
VAIGALLATALFVVPAATVRLLTARLLVWQLASIALVALEGTAGLWLSVKTNTPSGAAIAVVGGAVFALVTAGRALASSARRRVLPAAAGAALVLLSGCAGGGGGGGSTGLVVVATTTQIGDWVRQVGGADLAVHQILQPNTDPHEYEPRPKDVEATATARLVLENGDGLDDWMSKVVTQAGGHPKVIVLGNTVPVKVPGESSGPEASRYDPHWWHDPRNAAAAVVAIRDALALADPAHRRGYERRAAAYLARLKALDRGIERCLERVPVSERKLVTDHDAFNYFARRYGLTVVGAVIPSQTTQAQPSAGELARLIALIRRERVSAVFPESSLNPRLAQTVARETGAGSRYTLYGDTLGPAGSAGATYLEMEQANAAAMVRGFTRGAERCRIKRIG